MQLTYRNVNYQIPCLGQVTVPTGETGMYRGAKVHFKTAQTNPIVSGSETLTYRNAQYPSMRYQPITTVINQHAPKPVASSIAPQGTPQIPSLATK